MGSNLCKKKSEDEYLNLPSLPPHLQIHLASYLNVNISDQICADWNMNNMKQQFIKPTTMLWVVFSNFENDIHIEFGYFSTQQYNMYREWKTSKNKFLSCFTLDESGCPIKLPKRRNDDFNDFSDIQEDIRNSDYRSRWPIYKEIWPGLKLNCTTGLNERNLRILWKVHPKMIKFHRITDESMKILLDWIPEEWWIGIETNTQPTRNHPMYTLPMYTTHKTANNSDILDNSVKLHDCSLDMDFLSVMKKIKVSSLIYQPGSARRRRLERRRLPISILSNLIEGVNTIHRLQITAPMLESFNLDEVLHSFIAKSRASTKGITLLHFPHEAYCSIGTLSFVLQEAKFEDEVVLYFGKILGSKTDWKKFMKDENKLDIPPPRLPEEYTASKEKPWFYSKKKFIGEYTYFNQFLATEHSARTGIYTFVQSPPKYATFMYRSSRFIIEFRNKIGDVSYY